MTDQEKQDARSLWVSHTSPVYHDILDGVWQWDDQAQTFVSATGMKLRQRDRRVRVLDFIKATEADLRKLTTPVATVTTGQRIEDWLLAMIGVTDAEMYAVGAFAVGGFNRLQADDLAAIQGRVTTDTTFGSGIADNHDRLVNFANDIRRGDLSEVQIVSRAGSYASAAYPVYETLRRNSHKRIIKPDGTQKYQVERNRLDDNAEHCHTELATLGCPEITDMGWVPIGSLPPPGMRSCFDHCLCWLEYAEQSLT
jgi:hypothetical protein